MNSSPQLQPPATDETPSTLTNDSAATTFFRILAHELRNMLSPARNVVYLMRRHAEPELKAMTELLERQIVGIDHALGDLVDAERAAKNELELNKSVFDAAALLNEVVEACRSGVENRRQSLQFSPLATEITVHGDRNRLFQALVCVLANASKYSDFGGEIRVKTTHVPPELRIAIADGGIGIAPDAMSTIFDFPFSQHRIEKQPGKGLGLNLPLAHKILELHGGRMRVASAGINQGSVFEIWLPCGEVESSCDHGRNASSIFQRSSPGPTGVEKSLRRVLVIDDNATVRATISALIRDLGHEVQTANDGPEGLEAAERWKPNTVLLDINMPKLNGFEVARRLRKHLPDAKLIIMSGVTINNALLKGATQHGVDHCIDKMDAPLLLAELLQ